MRLKAPLDRIRVLDRLSTIRLARSPKPEVEARVAQVKTQAQAVWTGRAALANRTVENETSTVVSRPFDARVGAFGHA